MGSFEGNENTNDGKKSSYRYAEGALQQRINEFYKTEINGNFSQKEQEQVKTLVNAVKKVGGLANMETDDVDELIRIVKVLGSTGDKTTMLKDDVSELLTNIARRSKHI